MEDILRQLDQLVTKDTSGRNDPLLDGEVDLPSFQSLFTSDVDRNVQIFSSVFEALKSKGLLLYHRPILSPIDRQVLVWDDQTKTKKEMLMFGSNSYLGMANDPYVKEKVREALDQHGVGMGGPMLLNGTSNLHRQAEERLASFKGKEDCILIPTGYMTNLSWISTLMADDSILLYDEVSHASVADGIRLGRKKAFRFNHNDVVDLEQQLQKHRQKSEDRTLFVTIQGVYSMNGELAPVPEILNVCEKYRAKLVIDDAHGTGTMGRGRGTAEHFGVNKRIQYSMGTLSKAFSVTGGFFAGDKATINFLRFFSRPYFFSASISPLIAATILAVLDIIEREPERITRLHQNANRMRKNLTAAGINFLPTETAIIPIFPPHFDCFREMALAIHQKGLFVNSIEAPGVPRGRERFRVTLMSTHTEQDIDRAAEIFSDVFKKFKPSHEFRL